MNLALLERDTPQDTAHITIAYVDSPVGTLLLGATDAGVCMLEFTDAADREERLDRACRRLRAAPVSGAHPHLDHLRAELDEYFAGKRCQFAVPLVYAGTAFQRKVWQQLLRIPYGETRSYEQVANAIGAAGAQRAVGTANGQNRIAILIPCHRVVNKSGALGGFGGGLWRKQHLLDLERTASLLH